MPNMATMSKAIAGAYILALATCGASHEQSPKTGGILKFAVVAEPPSRRAWIVMPSTPSLSSILCERTTRRC
jgi:hypothetical protein